MQLLKYTVLRLGVFLLVFLGLWWGLRWPIFVAGIIGLIVAFAVSYLFFNKLRLSAGEDVGNAFARTTTRKSRKQLADEAIEDAYDEAKRGDASAPGTPEGPSAN